MVIFMLRTWYHDDLLEGRDAHVDCGRFFELNVLPYGLASHPVSDSPARRHTHYLETNQSGQTTASITLICPSLFVV